MNDLVDEKRRHNVLIVEDSPETRQTIQIILETNGLEVLDAANGKEALNLINEHPEIVVVFLDIMMPGMDGLVTLESIRKIFPRRNLKVCMLTSKNEKAIIEKAIKLGADDYVVKPVDPPILLKKLQHFLPEEDGFGEFAMIKTDLKAEIDNFPVDIDLRIVELSEIELVMESSVNFKRDVIVELISAEISKIVGNKVSLKCKIIDSKRENNLFRLKGVFIGFPENVLQRIRKITMNKEIIE